MKPWKRTILIAAATAAVIGTGSVAWEYLGFGGRVWNWVANAEEHHDTTDTEELEQSEMGKVLEILAKDRADGIVARKHTAKMCREKKVKSCRTCAEAGVYDVAGCK